MNTMLAYGFHGGHGAGGLFLVFVALALIAGIIVLASSERSQDKKP